ncbi:unnamed protein product [Calypogeia fissa]
MTVSEASAIFNLAVKGVSVIADLQVGLYKDHVDRNDVLQKLRQQTPAPLDFGPDRKYEPIADSVMAVRKTVENGDGSQVVTLYGGPGMGKTTLVKHLAILYKDDRKKRGMAETFPHRVYYLDCRQDAPWVLQLIHELLGNLQFGAVSGTVGITLADSQE